MTPAEELGYKVGQEFWLLDDSETEVWTKGTTITLKNDDGSNCPKFTDEDGEEQYITLCNVRPHLEDTTPCEQMGYKEGDTFTLNEGHDTTFEDDAIVTLTHDDKTPVPKFVHFDSDGDQIDYNYLPLGCVTKVNSQESPKAPTITLLSWLKEHLPSLGGWPQEAEYITLDGPEEGSCLAYWIKGYPAPKNQYPDESKEETCWGNENSSWECFDIDRDTLESVSDYDTALITREMYEGATGQAGNFTLTLTDVGNNKVAVIKAIRTITGLGLKESKDLSESTPSVICTGLTNDIAFKYHLTLTAAGAKATISAEEEASPIPLVGKDTFSGQKYIYFIDGESIEVTLVGYFEGSPVIVHVDQWGDPKAVIAKASLLTKKE